MSDAGPPAWPLFATASAMVAALWTALRTSAARELAFVKGELKAERAAAAAREAALQGALERLGAKHDALAARYERLCVQAATVAHAAGDAYRDAMPTDVRDVAGLMARATPALPAPAPAAAPRPRQVTVREEYAPGARRGPK